MKRIGVVEDHEDMQVLYRALFRKSREVEIVFQAYTAEEALREVKETRPDLVIVDISLPGMNGIALTRELRRLYPEIKILIATGHDRESYAVVAKESGADDFIEKGSGPELLLKTHRLVGLK